SHPLPPHIVFKAVGAGLLVLCLSFLLFALGFFGEGLLDLSDERMNGHAALNLSEPIAIDRFWRRIGIMLGFSAVLLVFALASFRIACVLKPKS
ncbi:MAG: hypothetical protein ACREEY_01245, partial [Brevundimonas sp.]